MKKEKSAKMIVLITTIIAAFYVTVTMHDDDLKGALTTFSQLSVAISIGIAAISIGININNKAKNILIEIACGIASLSIFTFFLAYADESYYLLQRIFLLFNAVSITVLLSNILNLIEKEEVSSQ